MSTNLPPERKFKVEIIGWGVFVYTESDINHDRSRGFDVKIIGEIYE